LPYKEEAENVWSHTFFTHPTAYAFKQWAVERKNDGRRKKERMKKRKQHFVGLFNETVTQDYTSLMTR
jgi:hypothetical protein